MKYNPYGRDIWFAWFPIRTANGTFVWLDKVKRIRSKYGTIYWDI